MLKHLFPLFCSGRCRVRTRVCLSSKVKRTSPGPPYISHFRVASLVVEDRGSCTLFEALEFVQWVGVEPVGLEGFVSVFAATRTR